MFLSESREQEKLNGICPNAFSLGTGVGHEMVKEISYINSCPIGQELKLSNHVCNLSD